MVGDCFGAGKIHFVVWGAVVAVGGDCSRGSVFAVKNGASQNCHIGTVLLSGSCPPQYGYEYLMSGDCVSVSRRTMGTPPTDPICGVGRTPGTSPRPRACRFCPFQINRLRNKIERRPKSPQRIDSAPNPSLVLVAFCAIPEVIPTATTMARRAVRRFEGTVVFIGEGNQTVILL